jgi:chemotaxis protein histidine kinase CheA
VKKRLLPLEITIFKVDEKLFGIESQKVFKLFKLPKSYQEKIAGQQKIRLKEFEIQMVDLKKTLSIGGKGQKVEIQILTVKENGEYKGWIVDQILEKLSVEVDISKDYGEYFMGMARWTYQEKLVEIPILNLKKI